MSNPVSRRGFLQSATVTGAAALGAGAATISAPETASAAKKNKYQGGISPWPLSMNTSTIRPASLQDKIKVTAEAGWDAIEPWIDDLEKYEAEGGNLKDLGKQITDLGLYVPNVIGLWNSIPENQAEWEASLEVTRKRIYLETMEKVLEKNGKTVLDSRGGVQPYMALPPPVLRPQATDTGAAR